jgi:acyl carrier protein
LYPAFTRTSFITHLLRTPRTAQGVPRVDLRAASASDRDALVGDYIADQIASQLSMPVGAMVLNKPIEEFGFDSLQATELKARIRQDLDVEIPVIRLLGRATIQTITAVALERIAQNVALAAPIHGASNGSIEQAPKISAEERRKILEELEQMTGNNLDDLLKRLA